MTPSDCADGYCFSRYDAEADPPNAARIRDELARWLRRRTTLDEIRACDVVLAVNEALANVAEFAYPAGAVGTVDLEVMCDPDQGTLAITVTDRGRWREARSEDRDHRRGRGIPLMRNLADAVVIDSGAQGSRVFMRFDHVHAGWAVGSRRLVPR